MKDWPLLVGRALISLTRNSDSIPHSLGKRIALCNVQRYVVPKKTPPQPFASCSSFFFVIYGMEDCAPSLVFGTNKVEVVTDGEPMDFLSLNWSPIYACGSCRSIGNDLLQTPTSCPTILVGCYFNWPTPPVMSCPHSLQVNFCLLVPFSGSRNKMGSNALPSNIQLQNYNSDKKPENEHQTLLVKNSLLVKKNKLINCSSSHGKKII